MIVITIDIDLSEGSPWVLSYSVVTEFGGSLSGGRIFQKKSGDVK